jgi:hypothetical protein
VKQALVECQGGALEGSSIFFAEGGNQVGDRYSVDGQSGHGAFGHCRAGQVGLFDLKSGEIGIFYPGFREVDVDDGRPGELNVVEGGSGEPDVSKG